MSKKSNRQHKSNPVTETEEHMIQAIEAQIDTAAPATTTAPSPKPTEPKELTLTDDQTEELKKFDSISGQIRYLSTITKERGDIARFLTIYLNRTQNPVRYQHVRNVLTTELKRKI